MADSQKGKKSKRQYSVNKRASSYGVYCSKTSRFITMDEIYTLLQKRKNLKLLRPNGEDFTTYFKHKAEADNKKKQALKKKQERIEAEKVKLNKQSGFFCDCLLSSRFSSVVEWQSSNTDIKPSEIAKPTPVTLDSNGYCAFCGYVPFYVEYAPTQGRSARGQVGKLLKGHRKVGSK